MKLNNYLKKANDVVSMVQDAASKVAVIKDKFSSSDKTAVKLQDVGSKNVKSKEKEEEKPLPKPPRVINSLEGMTSWLSELHSEASESVKTALNAQMMVIRFVQSPTLVDTTIDTLILNLKKSLSGESSPEMREKIHERFSLMIQNYVFFLDARLQAEINENKKEAQNLCNMAGDMLSQSVVDVAMLAVPGAGVANMTKKIAGVVVKNVFSGDSAANKDFFSGLFKLFMSDDKQKLYDFYKTVYNIIMKLDKYSDFIGKSMLISGMIERYTPYLVDYEYPPQESSSVMEAVVGLFVNKKEEPKLLRFNTKLIALKEDVRNLQEDLEEKNKKLEEINETPKLFLQFGKKKQMKKELEECIESLNSQLKEKNREIRNEELFGKENFEKSLLAIAAKFSEL